jgi:hypothetical protein
LLTDLDVVRRVYRHFADHGRRPQAAEHRDAYQRCADSHWLVLDDEGEIEMAIPFSGIPREHVVTTDGEGGGEGKTYWANCAWDTLGILAALGQPGTIVSPCPDCDDVIELSVKDDIVHGDAVFHILVPAEHWWRDIRFT